MHAPGRKSWRGNWQMCAKKRSRLWPNCKKTRQFSCASGSWSRQSCHARAEQAADTAEAGVAAAQNQLDALADPRNAAKSEVTRLEAEARAIHNMLNVQDQSLWPAVVDALQVDAGYETALGAAPGR